MAEVQTVASFILLTIIEIIPLDCLIRKCLFHAGTACGRVEMEHDRNLKCLVYVLQRELKFLVYAFQRELKFLVYAPQR